MTKMNLPEIAPDQDALRAAEMAEIDAFLPKVIESIPDYDILVPCEALTCESILNSECDSFVKWLVEEFVEVSTGLTGSELKEACYDVLLDLQKDVSAMIWSVFEWGKK